MQPTCKYNFEADGNMTAFRDVQQVLDRMRETRVTVFGDFCLDVYWILDSEGDEYSVETGLPLRRVREQRASLGGAGNVVANLAALGVKQVRPIGFAGKDMFGAVLEQRLREAGAILDGFLVAEPLQTMAYAKPVSQGAEGNRFDFGAFNEIPETVREHLLDQLRQAAAVSDVVILNQQVRIGLSSPALIRKVNEVIAAHPNVPFLVDSRHFADLYADAHLKLNLAEAATFVGHPASQEFRRFEAAELAHSIHAQTGRPVFLTCGEHGMLVAAQGDVSAVDALLVAGPTDPVGAGDTVVSALAAALGAGIDPVPAAQVANIAASVTIRKLHTTGTASPAEILAAAAPLPGASAPRVGKLGGEL